MSSHVTRVAAVAAVSAGCGIAYIIWLRRRRREPPATNDYAQRQQRSTDADVQDNCAICLEVPNRRCRTSCGHRFCVGCFRSWAERQVPLNATVRCPLCITPVTHLYPEFVSITSSDRRWLWGYNILARAEVRWARNILDATKFIIGACSCSLYVFSGHAWEVAQDAMRPSFAPLPTATDAKLRAASRWLVSAHILSMLQRVLSPNDPRNGGMAELLSRLRPVALLCISVFRDVMHIPIEH